MIFGRLREECAGIKDGESLVYSIMDYLGSTGYEVSEDDADFINEQGYSLSDFDCETGDYIIVVMNEPNTKRYMLVCVHNLEKQADILLGNKYTVDKEFELRGAKTLEEFNEILGGFGVERVRSISGENDFEYVNMGDAYAQTILKYKGELIISTYGDIIEDSMEDFE